MLLVALLLLLQGGKAEHNLAQNMMATYCDGREARELTDGDFSTTFTATSDDCHGSLNFSIDIGKDMVVNYVVVHLLVDANRTEQDNSTFFSIDMLSKEPLSSPQNCGVHQARVPDHSAMTVVCRPYKGGFGEVKVTFPHARNVTIMEIEIWTVGSKRHNVTAIHRGCFQKFEAGVVMRSANTSRCFNFCSGRNYSYAGLGVDENLFTGVCYCSNAMDERSEVEIGKCSGTCDDGSEPCGSALYFSVYYVMIQLPHYIGCMRAEVDFDNGMTGDISPGKCLDWCNSYKFALLKAEHNCKCADELPSADFNGTCDLYCGADKSRTCRSEVGISTYATCIGDHYRISCKSLFKCAGRWNEHGICDRGCEEGFAGQHCTYKVSIGERFESGFVLYPTTPEFEFDNDPITRRVTQVPISTPRKRIEWKTTLTKRTLAGKGVIRTRDAPWNFVPLFWLSLLAIALWGAAILFKKRTKTLKVFAVPSTPRFGTPAGSKGNV